LGSFFAGIKAGTLGGILYLGGLALFNVFLLYALKQDVLTVIHNNYSQVCTQTATVNSTSIDDCFYSVVAVYVPFIAFLGFFVSLLYAGIFGRYFDRMPGKGPVFKGETLAAIVGVNLLLFNLTGVYFDVPARLGLGAFFFVWTVVYGYAVGKLYKKYTRVVRFESVDPASVRIFVGGRDYTGKAVSLAHTSTHQIRADVADDASFKEWTISGGITVDDPRSYETAMEVNGDGLLKAQSAKKY
jgi:hypothetical protein